MKINLFEHCALKNLPQFIDEEVNALLDRSDSRSPFLQWTYPNDFSKEFVSQIEEYISIVLMQDIEISGGWMNATKYVGIENYFNWHNENGVGENKKTIFKGHYAGILWLRGEKNKGGDLKIIDDSNQIRSIPFNPPGLILLKKDSLHSVENYFSTERRISFNFDF